MREIAKSNAYVYEATQQHPNRILGFGWADPHLGVERSKDDDTCLAEIEVWGTAQ